MSALPTGIKHVVHISTNIGTSCEHCNEHVGAERFPESINHYIQQHGYQLLHVGTESAWGDDGVWHNTVAVLGVGKVPPAKKVTPVMSRKR
jgi:hypothetical protein